jgi:hypothetical protein
MIFHNPEWILVLSPRRAAACLVPLAVCALGVFLLSGCAVHAIGPNGAAESRQEYRPSRMPPLVTQDYIDERRLKLAAEQSDIDRRQEAIGAEERDLDLAQARLDARYTADER